MRTEAEILKLIGQPESDELEYKAVLPPARSIGQLITAFANAKGGVIILGVTEKNGRIETIGLSEDFRANSIVHKAIDLVSPKPKVHYFNSTHDAKRIYIIDIEPSNETVSIEGKIYIRDGANSILSNPEKKHSKSSFLRIEQLSKELEIMPRTEALTKLLEHYQSVLNIVSDLGSILYPNAHNSPTTNAEGKILMRIIFSSCADNFETYLSDLLYEIYLAKPETLRSEETVTIIEVLDCADIQEFINYYAKKKLSKLKKGSVEGFLSENKQIDKLKAFTLDEQKEVEKILQIRHLYSHSNGIVDEKFLKYFPEFKLNDLHEMSIDKMLDHISYLTKIASQIDKSAILKFKLATAL